MTATRAESVLDLLWVAAWVALLLWVAGEVGWSGLDKMDERCATDKTVRVHAEFDLALERVAGIVVG